MKAHSQEKTAGSLPRDMRIRIWIYSVMILAMLAGTALG